MQIGSNMFNSMKNGVTNTVGNVKSAIVSGITSAIEFITSLPSKAYGWGVDFVQGLINGIKAMIGKVQDAVVGVADKIRSFLHFSVPDEGPLTDYETWMPDFMNGLAKGIEKSKNIVTSAISSLSADMSVGMQLSPAMVGVGSSAKTTRQDIVKQGDTNINFNGSYVFADKNDIDLFFNQAALHLNRKK
jgi:hypothetical protein